MNDDYADLLLRRLDVQSSPDPEFVAVTEIMLRPRVRRARLEDMSRLGPLRRDLRLIGALPARAWMPRSIALAGLALLLILAVLAVAVLMAGGQRRSAPVTNGPLVIAANGEIRVVDVETGSSRAIGTPGEHAKFVSRSPDGRLVAYWTIDAAGDRLTFEGIDGQDARRVVLGSPATRTDCVDTWSPDSRSLASQVSVGGVSRIMLADATSGAGRLLTPEGMEAHCPLWSPDGRSIAFAEKNSQGSSVLAVIRTDGTALHTVSGDIGSADVAGANSWSSDGTWIYYTTGGPSGSIWRANVSLGVSTRLTGSPGFATAVAASPDGTLISWIAAAPTQTGWELYVANSDGTDPRLLLENAMNLGWSADGRYVLAKWLPSGRAGGVALVSPDGANVRIVVPASQSCLDPAQVCDVGWGQARP